MANQEESKNAVVMQPVAEKGQVSPFSSYDQFVGAYKMARCLAASSLVPDTFRGEQNTPNCVIALELANRLGMSVFMVMQNTFIIHGRPSFSSQFISACIQSCGRYSPLNYEFEYDKNGRAISCTATATELATGKKLIGPKITLEMAMAEGWLSKPGTKWKTMPDVMLSYRAATFFGRRYASDVLLGMQSKEELEDLNAVTVMDDFPKSTPAKSKTAAFNSLINDTKPAAKAEPEIVEAQTVEPEQENENSEQAPLDMQ